MSEENFIQAMALLMLIGGFSLLLLVGGAIVDFIDRRTWK
jgi:hypothetical protein